ncbi:MAG: hypothetical protein HYZ75_19895 [Elusimicrobia bacterium]|nr:hypothetical protein [Elusimicrobiota bacterium]
MAHTALLAALLALSAQAENRVEYTAPPPEAPGRFEAGSAASLSVETDKLRDALAAPGVGNGELHGRAAALFGGMTSVDGPTVAAPQLRGWEKPDRASQDSVDSMINRSGRTIAAAKFKASADAPPPPELEEAWQYGRQMRADGLSDYDRAGELSSGMLGVYLFGKVAAVGIKFHKDFQTIQRWIGDELAAATSIHESAHARDHAQGALNAMEVKKGEKQAFETEFKYLRLVDPTGQKLSWARVNFCSPDSAAPKMVCDYLTHLARISWHGETGDWDGLVSGLGYRDRTTDPFAHHHDDESEHGEHDGH